VPPADVLGYFARHDVEHGTREIVMDIAAVESPSSPIPWACITRRFGKSWLPQVWSMNIKVHGPSPAYGGPAYLDDFAASFARMEGFGFRLGLILQASPPGPEMSLSDSGKDSRTGAMFSDHYVQRLGPSPAILRPVEKIHVRRSASPAGASGRSLVRNASASCMHHKTEGRCASLVWAWP